jgi:hypothetical protein
MQEVARLGYPARRYSTACRCQATGLGGISNSSGGKCGNANSARNNKRWPATTGVGRLRSTAQGPVRDSRSIVFGSVLSECLAIMLLAWVP